MSINFKTFLDQTGYTPAYAARSILYQPESRPAKLAALLGFDVESERTLLAYTVAGRQGKAFVPATDDSKAPNQMA